MGDLTEVSIRAKKSSVWNSQTRTRLASKVYLKIAARDSTVKKRIVWRSCTISQV